MKKFFALALALVMLLGLAACGSKTEPAAEGSAAEAVTPSDDAFVVGICQLVQHEALDAATQGFKDALVKEFGEDGVVFEEQNAAGDPATCSTICDGFVTEGVDLILANATPALQAAATATDSIPVLGTSITEYGVALDLDNFNGVVGTNVSGTSDLAPLDEQAKMVTELCPDAKTVGIL